MQDVHGGERFPGDNMLKCAIVSVCFQEACTRFRYIVDDIELGRKAGDNIWQFFKSKIYIIWRAGLIGVLFAVSSGRLSPSLDC